MKKKLFALTLVLFGLVLFSLPFWKNMFYDMSIDEKTNDLVKEFEAIPVEKEKKMEEAAKEYNDSISPEGESFVDPFAQESLEVKNPLSEIRENGPIGVLKIPAIDLSIPVYVSATWEHLRIGAATVDGTSLPLGGKNCRSVIAGHRGIYDSPQFMHLDELKPGDRVYLRVLNHLLRYEVRDKEEILPYQSDKLAIEEGQDILTLLTCTPYPTARKRLLVNCVRVEDPVLEKTSTKAPKEGASKEEVQESRKELKKVEKKWLEEDAQKSVAGAVTFQKTAFTILGILGALAIVYVLYRMIGVVRREKKKKD